MSVSVAKQTAVLRIPAYPKKSISRKKRFWRCVCGRGGEGDSEFKRWEPDF